MSGGIKYQGNDGVWEYTLAAAVTAGDVIVIGEVVAVALTDGAIGDKLGLAIEGVFKLPKATTSGSAITAGAKLYWDDSSDILTTTAGSNKLIGYATAAAADSASTAFVRLSR